MSTITICIIYQATIWNILVEENSSRGGVAIYIRDGLKYKASEDLSTLQEGEFESIFVEILSGNRNKSVVVGEIYRVPNLDENISLERYDAVLGKLQKLKKSVIL